MRSEPAALIAAIPARLAAGSTPGAIRSRDWLYIGRWNPGDAYEELYDLPRDPQELDDVLLLNPALRDPFRAELEDYVAAGWAVTKGAYCGVRP